MKPRKVRGELEQEGDMQMNSDEWKKCDNKECDKVAFTILKDPQYEFQINVCPVHYEEVKRMRDWEILK